MPSTALKPVEAITIIFEQLKPKEKEKVIEALAPASVCERTGHNFRPAGVKVNWFLPQQVVLCCTKCGKKTYV